MIKSLKFNKLEYAGLFSSVAIIALCLSATSFTHAQNAPQVQNESTSSAPAAPNRVFSPEHRTALEAAIDNPLRIDKARDKYRHPIETLEFFGILPNDTVIEIWPGQGWYSSILGPYLRSGGGRFIGAHFDTASTSSNLVKQIVDGFRSRFGTKQNEFGDLSIVPFGPRSRALGPENSADAVLTFRNIHNWMAQGWAEKAFDDFYKVLKPGGILGIEEHRADDNSPQDPLAEDGYVREDYVIDMAKEAGFELVARAQINANPKDTKDHPFGVWTLPPVGRTSAPGQPENTAFDKSRFIEIGESDRMTLLFRKPIAPLAPEKPKTIIAGIRVPFPVRVVSPPKTPPPPPIIAAKKEDAVTVNTLPPPIDTKEKITDAQTTPNSETITKTLPVWRPKTNPKAAKASPSVANAPEAPIVVPTSTPVVFEVPPQKVEKAEETASEPKLNPDAGQEPPINAQNAAIEPKTETKAPPRVSPTSSANRQRSRTASPPVAGAKPNATSSSSQASTTRQTSARSSAASNRTQTNRPSPPPPPAKAKSKSAPAKKAATTPNRPRAPEPKTKAKALNVPSWNPNPPKKK